jgi:hypothetical protein
VPCTYADSIATVVINGASFDVVPNFFGENVSYQFIGPGAGMSGIGTINAPWSNGFVYSGLEAGLLPGLRKRLL